MTTEAFLALRLPHLVLRLIAAANLISLAADSLFPKYYRWLARINIADIIVKWFFISSVLLPLYVIIELWLMATTELSDRTTQTARSILLDGAFACSWCLVWWGGLLYMYTHNAIWL